MHIAIALRRRVRLFRLGAREGFEKKHQELAADLEPREGFEFFAHRPCPATQGSTFSARSARRVREKARGAGRSARGFEFSGWRGDQSKKSKNFWARKNRFPRKTFKSKNSFFRRRRPNAFLTDRGHGGFEFFAYRPCPATQGSIFSARSVRRVQEKSTWSWPRHRRVRNFGH